VGKECRYKCREWQDFIKQIDAILLFCSFQSAAPEYTGSPFRFCPWCGSRFLITVEADEMAELKTVNNT